MGIPRFFKFVNEKYPEIVFRTSFNQGFNVPGKGIDNLYLDANGIIHLFKAPPKEGRPFMPRLAKRKTPVKPQPTGKAWEKLMFQNVTKYIDSLLKYVKPKKLLYIAIDGPAPVAKQQQQRQRRFKSSLLVDPNNPLAFDGSSITPGTDFMNDLNEYLDYFIKSKMHTDPEWKKINVIFNNSNVAGEGEHKAICYIRSLSNKNSLTHCLYGLDADLFMLALSTGCPHFYLLREDVYTVSVSDSYFYKVDIGALIINLNKEFGTHGKSIVNDFIFICFMVGNDFLHNLQAFHDLGWSIEFILNIRKEILGDSNLVNPDYTVNFNNFLKLMEAIQPFEADFITEQFYANAFENITLNSSLLDPADPRKGIDFDKYSTLYYKKAGANNPEAIKDICEKYVSSLGWVNYYYHNPPINWRWLFPYHYSPLIKDIVSYLSVEKIKPVYNIKTLPLKPIEQLICVLPPSAFYLLPTPLHTFYTLFEKYYPKKFDIDLEGKLYDYEGVALLPFINLDEILPALAKSETDKGKTDKPKMYKIDSRQAYNYFSKFGNIKCNVLVKTL